MKPTKNLLIASALSCLLVPTATFATGYVIPATSDIFDAGRPTPIAPSGDPGALPVLVSLPSGTISVQFGGVTGTVSSFFNSFSIGPDGLVGQSSVINSYAGISGYNCDQAFALVGVFLTGATPVDPAPPTLNFTSSGIGRNFLSLSPAVGQLFFVGDGQTGSAQTQTFNVPAGATRLFLGFPDAPNWQGDPGHYGDNTGSLSIASITLVPEPATGMVLLCGALVAAARSRRNK